MSILDSMSERDKSSLLAKAIYGSDINELCTVFSPYQDGSDSQVVQEFFKEKFYIKYIDDETDRRLKLYIPQAYDRHFDRYEDASSEDLKTAIADCGLLVILEKKDG